VDADCTCEYTSTYFRFDYHRKNQRSENDDAHIVSSLIRNRFSFVDLSADSQKKVESRQLVVSEIALSFKHDYGCRNV